MLEIVLKNNLEPIMIVMQMEIMIETFEEMDPGKDKKWNLRGQTPDGHSLSVKFNSADCTSVSLKDVHSPDTYQTNIDEQKKLLEAAKR